MAEQNTGTMYQKPVRKIEARKAVELSGNVKKAQQEMSFYKWSRNYLLLLQAN